MGLLFDLLGNGAIAGSNLLMQDIKVQQEEEARAKENERMMSRQKELADYNSKLQQERDRAASELKEEMESKKQQRLVSDTLSARDRAEAIGSDRRFQDFKSKLGQTDATDEELRQTFKDQYDKKVMQVGDKVEAPFVDKGQSAAAGDYLKASQETGNSGLIASALKGVDDARQKDVADAKQLSEERRLALAERKQEEWLQIQERLADIREAASDKKASADKAVAVVDSARKFLSDQYSDLKAREKALEGNLSLTPDAKAKAISDMKSERADLDKKSKQLDMYFERLFSGEKRLSGEQPATEKPKEPQGKAYDGVSPDGSVRYKPASGSFTDQKTGKQYPIVDLNAGKSDSIEIIKKEYEKAVASGNAADASALARELKRLGVNVSDEPSQSNPSGGQSNRIVSIKRVG